MESLISGAECSTSSNPLSQVLKHTDGDRSLQRDKIDGPSSTRLHHLPHSQVNPANMADIAMARQFFESGSPQAGMSAYKTLPSASRQMLETLQNMGGPIPLQSPNVAPINAHMSVHTGMANWSQEFKNAPQVAIGPSYLSEVRPTVNYPLPEYGAIHSTLYQPSFLGSVGLNWDQEFARADAKGKGKAVDADFEAAFAKAAATMPAEKSRIVDVQDESESLEAVFERTRLSDDEKIDENGLVNDFEKVWGQLRNSELPPPEEGMAKWEAEFHQLMQSERDDYGGDFESAWKNGLGDLDELGGPEPMKYDDDGIPQLDPYKFELSNPYMVDPAGHLARAKQLINENGSLTDIALLLEAAIQHDELGEGGYEAWILLGETRSMDEREEAGMRALTEGVRRSKEAGNNDIGMISLAISYTNESYDRASHATLVRWLIARYPDLVPENLKGSLPTSPWASHDRATEVFLAVARQQHARGQMDPDLQMGLGVLFYTNGEFDKAKDCFESALAVRPKDYLLWNRLGSCLSNGSKPEEALTVYREALQLRPTYTRAIYNVGVACLNIGAYKEAAEHFLSGLAMQESSGGGKSEQLWQTLRKCFAAMERNDLAELAKAGQGLDIFRKEGFEF